MDMKVSCKSCGAGYTLSSQMSGKLVRCSRCKNQFRVPTQQAQPISQAAVRATREFVVYGLLCEK